MKPLTTARTLPAAIFLFVIAGQSHADPVRWQYGGNKAVEDQGWRAVSLAEEPAWRLYHLATDPGGTENVAATEAAKLQEMVRLWHAAPPPAPPENDWTCSVKFPDSEKPLRLFNGVTFDGWEGLTGKYWTIEAGVIKARNETPVPVSTYLFTRKAYRNFRLVFEVKQTVGEGFSTMHSAVCALGEKFTDKGDAFSFKGPLLMFCHDWGIWDANRRNRVEPANHPGTWNHPAERRGEWNRIEVLAIGDRIRFAANGTAVFDFTDKPGLLQQSPIGLQLHANNARQEYRFRGLILTENPEDRLITVQ